MSVRMPNQLFVVVLSRTVLAMFATKDSALDFIDARGVDWAREHGYEIRGPVRASQLRHLQARIDEAPVVGFDRDVPF